MPHNSQESFYQAVYRIVKQIPAGKVATYGQIAAILGHPRAARAVGYALHALTDESARIVPWQRVINAQGGISSKGDIFRAEAQRALLQREGIQFDRDDHVSLDAYRWEGPPLRLQFGLEE